MVTITDVANKVGYRTYFISNQSPAPGNMALALVSAASGKSYTTTQPAGDDMNVMKYLKKLSSQDSNFIVIHLEGSHDRYKDRIPPSFKGVHVDSHSAKENDYDSSILYTDEVLQNIYQYAKDNLNLQAMVYCSDHGEDMKSFHGDGYFTWDMIRTPGFVYLSSDYKIKHPAIADCLEINGGKVFTNDLIYDMVCGIMGAENTEYKHVYDITSAQYGLTWENAISKLGQVRIQDDPSHGK